MFTISIIKNLIFLIILGAQDESTRLPKRLETAVALFLRMNFDVLIHVTNASGLSAFNPVEHRMAPFSHDLTGILIPWDHFGSHLDASGNTVDTDLEVKNFHVDRRSLINYFEHWYYYFDVKQAMTNFENGRVPSILDI